MRVLFVDQFSDFGGAQLVLRDVMAEAKARGWQLWFAAPGSGALFSYCEDTGIPALSLPFGLYGNGSKSLQDAGRYAVDTMRSARLIGDCVRRHEIDVVYVNGPRVLAAASAGSARLVFHLHSNLEKRYARIMARFCLQRPGAQAIAASEFVASALTRASNMSCGAKASALPPAFRPALRGRVRVVYNGVPDLGFVVKRACPAPAKVAIVGRIAPEKGHLDFVRAAKLLRRRGLNVRFVVAGAALFSDPSYEAKVRAASAGLDIEFRGWTQDVAALLHETDILAAPCSRNECSPRILLEAFSAGTPVIAYPSGGIPELVRSGETGLLTASAAPEALASGIETLLRDRDLMCRLSMNGRREWESRFRVGRFRNDVAGIIERACGEQGSQAETPAAVACEHNLP